MTQQAAPERGIFCNRTLNLRSIGAIGYDMDYTLIQYDVAQWETLAYSYARKRLIDEGWPVEQLVFDPEMMIQGLIIDRERGNLLKVNRFGYVKSAFHGTHPMDFDAQRKLYARTVVDHRESRFVFLSTLFSVSEACLFAQLVDAWDAGDLPAVTDYADLYNRVRGTMDAQHSEGHLKAEICRGFDKYVVLDPQICDTLRDQRDAGKKLMLITNSDWPYTRDVMAFAIDRYLPKSMTWRDLFDLIIVSARKPDFFTSRSPLLEVVDEEGLLRPMAGPPEPGKLYFGGNASVVEDYLGLSGDQILYVGDHFFGDVHATKKTLRWRTALIVRELEKELTSTTTFGEDQVQLDRLMGDKETIEREFCAARVAVQRARKKREERPDAEVGKLRKAIDKARARLARLDDQISPLARAASTLGNDNWGLLMRAGNDKSYLARLVEQHADVYTSRVSNFVYETPFAYFRSARGSLPHD